MKSTTSFVGNLWEVLDKGDAAKAKLIQNAAKTRKLALKHLCSIGLVPLVFLLSCQLLAALWHGTALLSQPQHCLEGPLLTLVFGTEEHLHYKLQFQILTQLISESCDA